MSEELNRDLLDDDGENRAVRSFLMQYSCDRSITVGAMRKHMDMSGWPLQFCPPFARTGSEDKSHLTKAGAQIWIRHLLSMESATPPSPSTAREAVIANALSTGILQRPENIGKPPTVEDYAFSIKLSDDEVNAMLGSPSTASEVGELPPLPDEHYEAYGKWLYDADHMNDRYREGYRAALAAKTKDTTQPLCDSALRAEPAGQRDACTCVYATAANTPSVRKGYEMGGYLKQECDVCAKEDARSRAEGGNTQPSSNGTGEVDVEAERKLFEPVARKLTHATDFTPEGDSYEDYILSNYFDFWLAGRRTQAEGAKKFARLKAAIEVCMEYDEWRDIPKANLQELDAAIAATQSTEQPK